MILGCWFYKIYPVVLFADMPVYSSFKPKLNHYSIKGALWNLHYIAICAKKDTCKLSQYLQILDIRIYEPGVFF
jgi:hypothetical protein